MWEELSRFIIKLRDIRTVIIGDFNSVVSPAKKENCEYKKVDSILFSEFMAANDLIDVTMINSSFTWYGPANKKSR